MLGAKLLRADAESRVLQAADVQLIIHEIPAPYADSVVIQTPAEVREQQAIKPFFTVESLAASEQVSETCGGRVWGPIWPGPSMRVRNVCDPEGNVMHLRELVESSK